ncbi:tetratricopeptide repeat protein [Cohnella silvisoli]|uniref:Tetratricopeptide repeat protein n=1 Tax=Cohnella silvisoli TaxID=2873699 RepID=A0ABV1KZE6_9BACL|nr:hypothetical protein [Cohnella silvisoli]MCD9021950.1 hypothetical protein [Cohnella silvisoli]
MQSFTYDDGKQSKYKKLYITIVLLIVIVISLVVVYMMYFVPKGKYADAKTFMLDRKYEQAISIFAELHGYERSKEYLTESKYLLGKQYVANKDFKKGIEVFEEIKGYKDTEQHLENLAFRTVYEGTWEDKYGNLQLIFKGDNVTRVFFPGTPDMIVVNWSISWEDLDLIDANGTKYTFKNNTIHENSADELTAYTKKSDSTDAPEEKLE